MNQVELKGTLTTQPELKYTGQGLAITEFQLAGSDTLVTEEGTKSLAWYHKLTVFGALGENLAELPAGASLYANGRLDYQSWENKDGKKRSALKVVAAPVWYLGKPLKERLAYDSKDQPRLLDATNRVLVTGNLTKDAVLRHTGSGTPVLNVSIAVNDKYRKKGKDAERTHFVDVTAWRELGEANALLHKGDYVFVVGRLVTDSFTDRDGDKQYQTKIEAHDLQLIMKPGEAQSAPPPKAQSEPPSQKKEVSLEEFPEEEELPF